MTKRGNGAAKRRASGPSGATRTEDQRAEKGQGRLTLRLPQCALDRLTEIAASGGYTKAETIESMIDISYEEWQRVLAKKRAKVVG